MPWQCFLSTRFLPENYRRISRINLLFYWLYFITQQSGSLDLRTEYSVGPDFATLWAAWVESSHLSFLTFSFFICDVRKVEIIDLALFCSVSQLCPTLCDPKDCSMPGFPVHHQLLELPQTHVHRVGDAIQPSPAPMCQVWIHGYVYYLISSPSNQQR